MNFVDKAILNILAKSSDAFLLLISSMVMVRSLSQSEYGTFLQIMLIVNTSIMLTFFGLPQSIYYFYQKVVNRGFFIVQSLSICLVISFLTSILIYHLIDCLAILLNNPKLILYRLPISLLILFRAPSYIREPILLSQEMLITNSLSTVGFGIIFYAPIIASMVLSGSFENLIPVMLVAASAELFLNMCLIAWVYLKSNIFYAGAMSKELVERINLKDQLLYSFPIGVSSYLGIMGQQLDQYMISVFFLPRDLAVYSRGAIKIPIFSSIQFTINDIMMSRYVSCYQSKDFNLFLKYYHQCIEKVAKVNFPVFSFLFAVSPSLIAFLYTEEYIGASDIFRVYLFFLVIGIAVYGAIPRSSGKTSIFVSSTLVSIFCNVALSLLLIYSMGAIGAAIGTILATAISSFYLLKISCKILKVTLSVIFPWSLLGKLFLIAIISAVPVFLIEYFVHVRGVWFFPLLIFEGGLYGYVYIFIMMRNNMIFSDDIAIIERWLHINVKWYLRKLAFMG